MAALGTRVVCGQESRSTWACHREHPGSDVHRQVGPKLVWINGRKHLIMGFLKITFFELKFMSSTMLLICSKCTTQQCLIYAHGSATPLLTRKFRTFPSSSLSPKNHILQVPPLFPSTIPHTNPLVDTLSLLLGSHTL